VSHTIPPTTDGGGGNGDAPFEGKAVPRPLKGGHGTARGQERAGKEYIYSSYEIFKNHRKKTEPGNLTTPNGRD